MNIDYPRLFSRARGYTFLTLLLLFMVLFNLGAVLPIAPDRSQGITQSYKHAKAVVANSSAPALFVFLTENNALIALGAGVGGVLPFLAIFNSGQAVQALRNETNSSVPAIALTITTLIMPHSVVELSAYAVGATAGLGLLAAAIASLFKRIFMPERKRGLRAELSIFPVELAGAVALVIIAAALETTIIYSTAVGLALWFPLMICFWKFRKWAKVKAKVYMGLPEEVNL